MNFIRWVVGACFIVLCVIFAISNRDLIDLQFWPFPYALPVQTGLAVLLPAFITFLLGGIWVSFGKTKLWSRARQAEKRIVQLEATLQDIEEQLQQTEARNRNEAPNGQALTPQNAPEPRQLQNR
jgi:lipopolysaccharide assembly protein A